jgi:molecular chaperone HscA
VKPSYGLADEDISRMLKDSFEHARDDMHVRALQESRVDGERLLEAVRAALAADAELLAAHERADIDCRVDALAAAIAGTDHRAIKSSTDALNRVTEEFAARRMDRSVRTALTGRNIANIKV